MPLAFCLKEARGQSCSCWVLCCGTWLLLWRRFSWRWTSWKLFCSTYLVEGTYTGWFFYFDVDLYIFCLFIIKVLLKVFLCASWTCIKCSHTTLEILINMGCFEVDDVCGVGLAVPLLLFFYCIWFLSARLFPLFVTMSKYEALIFWCLRNCYPVADCIGLTLKYFPTELVCVLIDQGIWSCKTITWSFKE